MIEYSWVGATTKELGLLLDQHLNQCDQSSDQIHEGNEKREPGGFLLLPFSVLPIGFTSFPCFYYSTT